MLRPVVDTELQLRDGRRLGYAEWGPDGGRVVFHFHGSPAGRLDRWGDDTTLDRLNVRLVTVDRPGIGRSGWARDRRVLDFAADVEQLADALGVERFPVLGFSAGGAYAAACAAALPERVEALGLISPIGRVDERGVDGMSVAPYLKLAARAPWAMRAVFVALALMAKHDPDRAHRQTFGRAPRADRDVLDRPHVKERYWWGQRDSLGGRARGIVGDMAVNQRPWGYDAATVTVPAHFFHGTKDRTVPPEAARYWPQTLPDCRERWYEGEGHFLIEDRFEEALGAVLATSARPGRPER